MGEQAIGRRYNLQMKPIWLRSPLAHAALIHQDHRKINHIKDARHQCLQAEAWEKHDAVVSVCVSVTSFDRNSTSASSSLHSFSVILPFFYGIHPWLGDTLSSSKHHLWFSQHFNLVEGRRSLIGHACMPRCPCSHCSHPVLPFHAPGVILLEAELFACMPLSPHQCMVIPNKQPVSLKSCSPGSHFSIIHFSLPQGIAAMPAYFLTCAYYFIK